MTEVHFDIRCNITAAASGGVLAGFEQTTEPGEGPPLHTHRNETEIFHIIDGEYVFVLNGERMEVTSGDVVIIPAGAEHTFKNAGSENGRVHFVLYPPSRYEEFFERVVKEFSEIEDHAAFFDEYGMDLNGPPLD